MEAHEIKIYWPARAESLGQCASRVRATLEALGGVHRHLHDWFFPANAKQIALTQPVDLSGPDAIGARLGGGKPLATCETNPTGYRLALWNGADEPESVGFKVSCGHFSRWLPWNTVTVNFSALPDDHEFKSLVFQNAVLERLVDAWAPTWGLVTSWTTHERLDIGRVVAPYAGWLTWLADTDFPAHLVEGFGTVTRLHNGSLITLGDKPLSADRPEDLAILRKGQEALVAAGIAGAPSAA